MFTKEQIQQLDNGTKYKIWFHYYLTHLGLKYNFHVRDISPHKLTESNTKGWGEPDKVYGNIEIRYLWKDLRHIKFEHFDDERLWEWYWRFADEIDHLC